MELLSEIFNIVAGMSGLSAFVAVLLNVGKKMGIVKDGQAPVWSACINLIVLIALFAARVFNINVDASRLNELFAGLAQIGSVILTYLASLAVSRLTHTFLRGAPLIGTSYTHK